MSYANNPMTLGPHEPISIAPAPLEHWQTTLELVLSQRPPLERQRLIWWIFQEQPHERLAGLWEARQGERTVGAALAMTMPGSTALVYQPRCLPGVPASVAQQLWEAINHFLAERGVRLAQEVLPADAEADAVRSREAGFTIETRLLYYSALVATPPFSLTPASLRTSRCFETDREVLERLIERTYEGTLDCPELNGVRSPLEVTEGYLEGRPWGEHQWHFVLVDGQTAGCVLLTPRGSASIELVYLGLVPEVRAQGLGRPLIEQVLRLAAGTGATEITVAVDVRNTPARRIYEAAGFREFDQRRVMLRVLSQ